ncbi:prefoldin subunit alpha [Candidatus Woesearchaeota archaeon]|nr:prefoldin subunit alpha [Candidatus Woesearchaeota archaeon]
MNDKKQNKELQESFFELQMMQQQMKELQKQIEKAEEQLMEVEYLQQSIQELSETKEETEILIPIASGIFAKAKLQDGKHFLVNVGAETCTLKDHDQVKKMLAQQAQHIIEVHEHMTAKMQDFMQHLQDAEQQIQKESHKK